MTPCGNNRRGQRVALSLGCTWFALFMLLFQGSSIVRAEQTDLLIVAAREVPPFAFQGKDGQWRGISIDLWRQIAGSLEIEFRFEKSDLEHMLTGVADGRYDAAVAALTMTAERETLVDFTHPFYSSGLGILVKGSSRGGWWAVAKKLISPEFAGIAGGLAVLLLFIGFLTWLFERKRNPEQFGGRMVKGLASGFWWSAVTMTTVGYGDKTPVTTAGRLVALIWMFASLLLISSFTAAIASALTVSQLESGIDGPEDLPGLHVATVAGSTSEKFLRTKRILTVAFDSPLKAVEAVADDRADAAVFDAPVLKYLVKEKFRETPLRVIPRIFAPQNYAIALKPESPLRELINRQLLAEIARPQWSEKLFEYLGE